jgi:hypothetical protein
MAKADIIDLGPIIETRRNERMAEDLRQDQERVARAQRSCAELLAHLDRGTLPPDAIIVDRPPETERRPTLRIVSNTEAPNGES